MTEHTSHKRFSEEEWRRLVDDLEPLEFLRAVARATPGWAQRFGGPEGVARLAVELQDELRNQSRMLSALRGAAIQELLNTSSLDQVAKSLGISKQAASKAAREKWSNLPW